MDFAIINAAIETVTRGRIEGGTVVVKKGRIFSVGKSVKVPAGLETIDAGGKLLTPGFMDPHTHAGMCEDGMMSDSDINERVDPVTPQLRAIDAFKPTDVALMEAAQSGVTSAFITPGSANVFGGLGAVVKTAAPTLEDQVVKLDAGLKMATGENPKRIYGEQKKSPATRMGTAAVMRAALTKAQIYGQKKRKAASKKDPFDTDLTCEALCGLLDGKYPSRCHAHRSVDMLTAMRVSEEFGFRLIFEHATECEDILDELAQRKIPVIIGPSMWSRSKVEVQRKGYESVSRAVRAGLLVAITADCHVTPLRYLTVYAALAIREGLDQAEALKILTINPAIICGVDDRIGSIEKGKDADLVLWESDPFDVRSRPAAVWITGRRVDMDAKPFVPMRVV
jgi:imidazolonepropionase-like amidohydrolase